MDNPSIIVLIPLIILAGYIVGSSITNQMNEPLFIYVAGKYWNSTEQGRLDNTYAAIDAGIEIMKKCHYPLIPHVGHWIDARMNQNGEPPRPNDWWYEVDNRVIPKVDMLLKISSSNGANAEEKFAKSLGIPVVYSLDEIPDRCK